MITLFFAGRLEREKGVEILIDFLDRLSRDDRLSRLVRVIICGDGSYRERIGERSHDMRGVKMSEVLISERGLKSLGKGAPRRGGVLSIQKGDAKKREIQTGLPDSPGVYFYGHRSREDLALLRAHSDFALMPSIFLETFGLSALESIEAGLRVIGIRKGGLIPFVHPSLSIDESRGGESLLSIINSLGSPLGGRLEGVQGRPKEVQSWGREGSREGFSHWLPDISRYSRGEWGARLERIIETLRSLTPSPSPPGEGSQHQGVKKILLISDYLAPIGGIETYLAFLRTELEGMGYRVETFGYPSWISPLGRQILFALSLISFWRYWRVQRVLKKIEPDIIWCHATLRYIGIWGLFALMRYQSRTLKNTEALPHLLITHHDFGLFCAYPSQVRQESDIPRGLSLAQFLGGKGSNILSLLLLSGKWLYLRIYWHILQRFSLHLVPSDFMVEYVEGRGVSRDRIEVFEHTSL